MRRLELVVRGDGDGERGDELGESVLDVAGDVHQRLVEAVERVKFLESEDGAVRRSEMREVEEFLRGGAVRLALSKIEGSSTSIANFQISPSSFQVTSRWCSGALRSTKCSSECFVHVSLRSCRISSSPSSSKRSVPVDCTTPSPNRSWDNGDAIK